MFLLAWCYWGRGVRDVRRQIGSLWSMLLLLSSCFLEKKLYSPSSPFTQMFKWAFVIYFKFLDKYDSVIMPQLLTSAILSKTFYPLLNFIFDCPKIWLDWSKEKHWFNKIEATRFPSIECKDSLLKGMVCCGVTSILCCIWVSEYFAIDLSIYFGYCHLPSSKASIKSLQQCLLKIHVLVVWLLVFLILSVVIFFGAFLHELSKWPALQGYFFHQVNSFAWWKQYTVVLY